METRSFLQAIEPSMIDGAQSHIYDLKPSIAHGWYGGGDYIRYLILPDFFFHIAIAHAILRHLGVPIGTDFSSAPYLHWPWPLSGSHIGVLNDRKGARGCRAATDPHVVVSC